MVPYEMNREIAVCLLKLRRKRFERMNFPDRKLPANLRARFHCGSQIIIDCRRHFFTSTQKDEIEIRIKARRWAWIESSVTHSTVLSESLNFPLQAATIAILTPSKSRSLKRATVHQSHLESFEAFHDNLFVPCRMIYNFIFLFSIMLRPGETAGQKEERVESLLRQRHNERLNRTLERSLSNWIFPRDLMYI